jgi:hypothetical protein
VFPGGVVGLHGPVAPEGLEGAPIQQQGILLGHVGLGHRHQIVIGLSAGSNQPVAMSITPSAVRFSVSTICTRVLLVEPVSFRRG